MPAINAHGEFTPTPENHITPRPHSAFSELTISLPMEYMYMNEKARAVH